MPRQSKTPTVWQARWLRSRRIVFLLLVVAMILSGIFVSFGISAALLIILVGLAAFAGGGPTDNGRTRATDSTPGSQSGV